MRHSFSSIFFVAVMLFSIPQVHAQTVIEWESNFGGSVDDYAHSIIQTIDGGYAVVGASESSDGDVGGNKGARDYWVVKLDDQGSMEWESNFGGSGPDVAHSLLQTSDGGYVVVGFSESSDGDVGGNKGGRDYWILKLDGQGGVEWESSFGGSGYDIAKSIVQTSDGGYMVVGSSESSDGDVGGNKGGWDQWVVKLDDQGVLEWENNFGGSDDDYANSIIQTSDGGYAVAGASGSSDGDVGGNNGHNDFWIVKLDDQGAMEWESNFGGMSPDYAYSIIQANNGGYVVAGYTGSSDGDVGGNNGNNDYWVVKLDDQGAMEWESNFGGSGPELAFSIIKASDGGYAMVGYTESSDGDVGSNNGYIDYWVVKLDDQGFLEWESNLGGSGPELAYSIIQASDGGYAMVGGSESFDGDVGDNNGINDFWIVKFGDSSATSLDQRNKRGAIPFTLHPNPTDGPLHIDIGKDLEELRIIIRDLTGSLIKTQTIEDSGQIRIEGEPGLYLLELEGEDGERSVRKVIKH